MKDVAIIGASNKPDRYAYMAFKMLRKFGHEVYPVSPALQELEGVKVYSSLKEIPVAPDTITLYVNPYRLKSYVEELLACKPRRVIFNPGTESPEIEQRLNKAGIQALRACTLVLLQTHQF